MDLAAPQPVGQRDRTDGGPRGEIAGEHGGRRGQLVGGGQVEQRFGTTDDGCHIGGVERHDRQNRPVNLEDFESAQGSPRPRSMNASKNFSPPSVGPNSATEDRPGERSSACRATSGLVEFDRP